MFLSGESLGYMKSMSGCAFMNFWQLAFAASHQFRLERECCVAMNLVRLVAPLRVVLVCHGAICTWREHFEGAGGRVLHVDVAGANPELDA